jgi:hypothetical protein
MTRDEIMHLVNETAPRYQSWGIEAHFQAFAQRLLQIEREACAEICDEEARWATDEADRNGAGAAAECGHRIRARGGE